MRGEYYVKVAVRQQITIYVKLAADSFEQLASQQLSVIWLLQNGTLPAHRPKILWAFATAKYCNTVSSSTAVTVFFVVLLMFSCSPPKSSKVAEVLSLSSYADVLFRRRA